MTSSKNSSHHIVLRCLAGLGLFLLIIFFFVQLGFRINPTNSMPPGLYKLRPPKEPLKHGQIVFICPTDSPIIRLGYDRGYYWRSGNCEHHYFPFVKSIAALPGDHVKVTKETVLVNGKVLKNSTPMKTDNIGNPMPKAFWGEHIVQPGEVWLVSSYNPRSFDSRYWGPLPIKNIQGIATPIWVKKGPPQ